MSTLIEPNLAPVISVKKLSKSFGDKEVLKSIDLELYKGENLVIVGKSGSGKSVLIKCLVKLILADAGEINVLGVDLNIRSGEALLELRKKMGFLFQSAALYDSMTVKENLLFPLRNSKDKDKINDINLEEALADVGLADTLDKMPSELSGGMRKRLGLARTLITKPQIIFYDEPTTGLDPITSREISELMLTVQEKYQTSSIIITHDISCAEITANRVLVIKDGSVYGEGSFSEMQNSNDDWIKSMFQIHVPS